MINRETILKLYNGELYTANIGFIDQPVYNERNKEVIKIAEQLTKLLPDNKKNLIKDFTISIQSRSSFMEDLIFFHVFSLGSKIAVKSLIKDE